MDILLVLPILVPLFTAVLCVLAWQKRDIQRSLAVGGSLGLLIVGLTLLSVVLGEGIQVSAIGGWEAPFGIVLVADLFGTIMVVMAGLVGSAVTIFSLVSVDETRRSFGYYPVLLILLMGVCGASLTGDMFNLYVWFEIILITSFVLLTLGSERVQLEGAIKYFALNLLVSAFFLTALGVLYGLTGSLNMAALAQILPQSDHQGLVTVLAMMFMVAFGIKSAMFPLFFWLPASYHTPPVAVTTLFSGLMTKVGVYAMVRIFTLMFTSEVDFTHNILLILAGLTMFTGVVGAVAQYDFRRLLSFHIISQIGYLIMGLGLFSVASLTGMIFFLIHVIIAKSALFLVSGVSNIVCGTYDLKKLGGLYRGYPLLAVLFFIPAMSLGGIPPFSGFWAKLALIRAGLEQEQYLLVAVSLLVSVLTLFSMTKIWAEAFWKDSPRLTDEDIRTKVDKIERGRYFLLMSPLVVLAFLTIVFGIFAEPVLLICQRAAEQLINHEGYIQAVLGGGG